MALLEKKKCRCGTPYAFSVHVAMGRTVNGGLPERDRQAIVKRLFEKKPDALPTYWCRNCDDVTGRRGQ